MTYYKHKFSKWTGYVYQGRLYTVTNSGGLYQPEFCGWVEHTTLLNGDYARMTPKEVKCLKLELL